SGGPFRDVAGPELARVTVQAALSHPTWSMGPKITVDSATLVNKGLEVIEAHHLFGVAYDAIEVYIHRQSLVHSLVELVDGAILAQLGQPDMRGAIAYALSYPRRLAVSRPRLDLLAAGPLTFQAPRWADFPGLGLGYAAGRAGGTLPAVYSAANEAAVQRFLAGAIGFQDIPRIIQRVMEEHRVERLDSLEHVLAVDAWASQRASTLGPAKAGGT
ncbi:MAG TPA: 1-deoxy-D-xylulose-5-phosphate reductoisomerase, partial [Clostridiales bacterium UBA8153]|nr:1-deoxy-D-xylulose-5-phosphate reductoisomerase [Clostridiales bacterium UBA8153]